MVSKNEARIHLTGSLILASLSTGFTAFWMYELTLVEFGTIGAWVGATTGVALEITKFNCSRSKAKSALMLASILFIVSVWCSFSLLKETYESKQQKVAETSLASQRLRIQEQARLDRIEDLEEQKAKANRRVSVYQNANRVTDGKGGEDDISKIDAELFELKNNPILALEPPKSSVLNSLSDWVFLLIAVLVDVGGIVTLRLANPTTKTEAEAGLRSSVSSASETSSEVHLKPNLRTSSGSASGTGSGITSQSESKSRPAGAGITLEGESQVHLRTSSGSASETGSETSSEVHLKVDSGAPEIRPHSASKMMSKEEKNRLIGLAISKGLDGQTSLNKIRRTLNIGQDKAKIIKAGLSTNENVFPISPR